MLDLPEPLRPVTALNWLSKGPTTTRCAYDLKPSIVISLIHMAVLCPAARCAAESAARPALAVVEGAAYALGLWAAPADRNHREPGAEWFRRVLRRRDSRAQRSPGIDSRIALRDQNRGLSGPRPTSSDGNRAAEFKTELYNAVVQSTSQRNRPACSCWARFSVRGIRLGGASTGQCTCPASP